MIYLIITSLLNLAFLSFAVIFWDKWLKTRLRKHLFVALAMSALKIGCFVILLSLIWRLAKIPGMTLSLSISLTAVVLIPLIGGYKYASRL